MDLNAIMLECSARAFLEALSLGFNDNALSLFIS